jgi:ketosteroid isomerase-like protein
MYRLLTALALATIAVPTTTAAQCSEADRKALEAFDRAWGEATTRGDRAQLQTMYADDYMGADLTGQVGKSRAIDDAVRQAERNRANPAAVPKVTYGHYVIHCTPTTATITHRAEITTTVGGKEQATYGRSIHVLEKRGGRWQVVSNAGHPLNDAGVLLYMVRDWNDAARGRDVAWMERNLTDDATITRSAGNLMTKAEWIAGMRADRTTLESVELSDVAVRVEGNAAVVTGVNRLRGRDAQGNAIDRRARFTGTYVKRDGRWLVWAAQSTTIP